MKSKFVHCAKVLLFFSLFYIIFFFPVLFRNRLLAPGDALVLYLPSFLSPVTLWEPNLQAGFPVAADLQTATWYPLARFFALFSWWNGFVVAAYVLTSCFSYAYVYFLTRSWVGSLVAGIVAGSSGFMIAHLGHTIVIHGFVWIPLILLSIEKIAARAHRIWFIAGSASVAFTLLSGHPQIPAYGILVSILYVLMRTFLLESGKLRFFLMCFGIYAAGLALTSIQLVPLFELVSYSVRDESTFAFFNTYSVPPLQLVTFIFPLVFGVLTPDHNFYPYFGSWNFTEMTGYVGLMPLMLSIIGFKQFKPRYFAIFWASIAMIGLLLSLGESTPLAKVMFQIPLINRFRVPARHFSEMTLALSFLAGFGASLIHKKEVSWRFAVASAIVVISISIVAGAVLLIQSGTIQAMANNRGVAAFSLLPWKKNLSIAVPIVILFSSSTALIWASTKQGTRTASMMLLVIAFDLWYFGNFCDWKHAPQKALLNYPQELKKIGETLNSTHQRLMPVFGVRSWPNEGQPNLSRLWNIPSGSGYGSLVMRQINELLSMPADGGLYGNWASRSNRSLDLMAVRYISWSTKTRTASKRQIESEIPWSTENMQIQIGADCGGIQTNASRIKFPIVFETSSIGIVSSLSCAMDIKQKTPVVRITLIDENRSEEVLDLMAGVDTAEWSYDCYRPGRILHSRPPNLKMTIPMRSKTLDCDGQMYVSKRKLKKPIKLQQIKFNWIGPQGLAAISKLTLINNSSGDKFPVSMNAIHLSQSQHWKKLELPGATLFENERAMPRAWLVHHVSRLSRKNILRTISTSHFPDGAAFRPKNVGLIEDELQISGIPDRSDSVRIMKLQNRHIEIQVRSKTPALLVVSDVFYPGWKAVVNAKPARIYRANFAFRGVPVPAGKSTIKMDYEPSSFRIGATLTLIAILFLGSLLLVPRFRNRVQPSV